MMNQFEIIDKFSSVVEEMTKAIDELRENNINVVDVRNIMNILNQKDAIQMMDYVAMEFGAYSESKATAVVPTKAPTKVVEKNTDEQQAAITDENVLKAATNRWKDNLVTESNIREICEAMIKCDFGYTATLEYCKKNNIKCTVYTITSIRNKSKWSNITDEYFTKNGHKYVAKTAADAITKTDVAETNVEDVVEETAVADDAAEILGIVMPSSDVVGYIRSILKTEHNSIRRAYMDAVAADRDDISIYDVFNVKYSNEDGSRKKPILSDDINVIVRYIAETYDYDIDNIAKVMRQKCDVICDSGQFHVIRKLAKKAGRQVHERTKNVIRKTELSDDEKPIGHVLARLELNILQTFLHFRATPKPITILDAYRVKQKIGTVMENDVKIVIINLKRSMGMTNPAKIAEYVNRELELNLDEMAVRDYIHAYEEYKANKARENA